MLKAHLNSYVDFNVTRKISFAEITDEDVEEVILCNTLTFSVVPGVPIRIPPQPRF
jgi:hypothetical protein